MTNRITGIATGLDVETLVKNSMKTYNVKVDTEKQKKDVLLIKQKLYRDVIKDGQALYNKYFDIAKTDSLLLSKNYGTTKFTSGDPTMVTATALGGAIKDNYSVNVTRLASSANTLLSDSDLVALAARVDPANKDISITNGATTVTITAAELALGTDNKSKATIINDKLATIGMKATYSDFTKGITIETNVMGSLNKFSMKLGDDAPIEYSGTDLEATVTNSKGTVNYGDAIGNEISSKNSVLLDGVQFNMTKVTGAAVNLTASTDVTDVKTKIVNFVNDYNKFIEKLNTLTIDKHDRSYSPLSDDQKKDMSEDEIKLWNEKVEKGQLSRDNDLSRINNNLKRTMGNSVIGSTTTLEKIGISPIADYTTKNGMFTIDEDKLTKALEADPNAVMTLFTKSEPTDPALTSQEKTSQTGIMYRLKSILNDELVSSTKSALIKRAGYQGTTSFTQSTLSKQITAYESKIKTLQSGLTAKEQALYTKYSKLEVAMNKYNSQQSYLTSQLGS